MAEQQPPQQPQWSPPPQQPMGWGGPGYGGPPPRPTGVTLGAIFLIVMGVLVALVGAACGVFGGAVSTGDSQIPGLGAVGGALAIFGIIALVIGILQIAAGAGALGGKGWARWTGVVVSIIFVIFGVLGLLGGLTNMNNPNSGGVSSLAFSAFITVAYALTAWTFVSASAFFGARR
jgi:hypothetical protein